MGKIHKIKRRFNKTNWVAEIEKEKPLEYFYYKAMHKPLLGTYKVMMFFRMSKERNKYSFTWHGKSYRHLLKKLTGAYMARVAQS